MTIYDFLEMAMDDFYKINIYDTRDFKEIVHQKEVGEIKEMDDILDKYILSWDIEETTKEFCLNVE